MSKQSIPSPDQAKLVSDLTKYSLAAGAACLCAGNADAAVHYTPDSTVIATNGTYSIDMDGDGTNDVRFINNYVSATNFLATADGENGAALGEDGGIIDAIPAGSSISSTDPNWRIATMDLYRNVAGSIKGEFTPGTTAYVPVRLDIAGGSHYGWIKYKVNADGTSEILGWAYEDVADKPIKAGDTGAVVEADDDNADDNADPHPVTGDSNEYINTWQSRIEDLFESLFN